MYCAAFIIEFVQFTAHRVGPLHCLSAVDENFAKKSATFVLLRRVAMKQEICHSVAVLISQAVYAAQGLIA